MEPGASLFLVAMPRKMRCTQNKGTKQSVPLQRLRLREERVRSYDDFRGQGAAIHMTAKQAIARRSTRGRGGGGRVRMHVMVAEMAERSDVQTEGAPLVHEWTWMVHGCTIHVHSCTVVNHGGGAASVRILQWCSAAASKRGVSCGVPCSPCQIHQEVQMGVCFAVR